MKIYITQQNWPETAAHHVQKRNEIAWSGQKFTSNRNIYNTIY